MRAHLSRLYNFFFATRDDKQLMIGFFLAIAFAIVIVVVRRYLN